MSTILYRLSQGETLTRQETCELMLAITRQEHTDLHIAAMLTAIQTRGVTVDELLGLRDGLLQTGIAIDLLPHRVLDIVGTGGDGKYTFNISTCACLIVAGAGYKVAKHGNYASTSVSGASTVIEGHGVRFTADADHLRQSLEETNFTYLHAPLFASGMKFVAPARRALQVPTVFNLIGPLVNPSRPTFQLLGTATLQQLRLYSNVKDRLDEQYGIVTSLDGYDEISLTGPFKIKTPTDERIIQPEELGLPTVRQEDIYGGDSPEEARQIFDNVLRRRATVAQTAVVLANAAAAIHIIEAEKTFEQCLAIAKESLDSGAALDTLQRYVNLNK